MVWLIVLIVVFFVLLFIEVYRKKHRAEIKGKAGEQNVIRILETLDRDKYILLNDVVLSGEYGTTQVDHILVSVFGVFVIETKNYTGMITGNEDSEYWTQNIYGHKSRFKNPIRQNYGHICATKKILPDSIPIYSVIVFSDDARVGVDSVKAEMAYMKGLINCIRSHEGTTVMPFSTAQEYANRISGKNVIGDQVRQQHVKEIKEKTADIQQKISMGICPKCGGRLVIRNGKYGSFTGCSNYPKCHFTLQK